MVRKGRVCIGSSFFAIFSLYFKETRCFLEVLHETIKNIWFVSFVSFN